MFDAGYFSRCLGKDVKNVLIKDVQELEQSQIFIVQLQYDVKDKTPFVLLLKRYNLVRLMSRIQKPLMKWRISALSFANEYTFCTAISDTAKNSEMQLRGVLIPAVLHTSRTYPEEPSFGEKISTAGLEQNLYNQAICTSSGQHSPSVSQHFGENGNTCSSSSSQTCSSECSTLPSHLREDHQKDNMLNFSYDLLFDYVDPHLQYQVGQLNLEETKAALKLLANFHAYFWRRSELDEFSELRRQLFRRGGWWRKELRPSVAFDTIPSAFKGLCESFPEQELLGTLDNRDTHAAMNMLCTKVDWINEELRAQPDKTILHGDAKTSNLFFCNRRRQDSGLIDGAQSLAPSLMATCIDFQWVGNASSGMGDVVYLLSGAVQYKVLKDNEQGLLKWYWECLCESLQDADRIGGVPPEYSWDQCQADEKLEYLAYFVTALPQLMGGLNAIYCQQNVGKFGWLTHEMDPRVITWMCQKAKRLVQELF
ncbi:hypothetical protein CEUSTIGMA_g3487.t1 [Chlamydomonas eustigma]|uniref:CHK kinase-like domain-containing protein n=1 Tax=Chlamydomonas eustigma TaxID=1157962 RepID=A0A250WYX0_9CHLO|nr:hypothetical protein CEUSTIGMA_g3487.t1 [Chlamydomonas eustigma]|eukprot:GAX76044.1 hypothetical protein CEUSTIGMA_g3487.t1 [Chlamydomonas eustigma]